MPFTTVHDPPDPRAADGQPLAGGILRDAIASLLHDGGLRPGPWLDAQEAASYLGVAVGTIRNWTSMRYIPHAKRRGVVRYHRDELDRWMAGGARRGRRTRPN